MATDDAVFVSAGWCVPAAGQLTELYFDGPRGGFFRDSAGQVWPLPVLDITDLPGRFSPHGGELQRDALWKVASNLLLDAGDDVRRPVPWRQRGSRLAKRIDETDAPLVIESGDPVLSIEDFG